MNIAVLPGDGIGTAIITEAVKVLQTLGLGFELATAPVGGVAYAAQRQPLPAASLRSARQADTVLGDWRYDTLQRHLRAAQAMPGWRKKPGWFAIRAVLAQGLRTADIYSAGTTRVSTVNLDRAVRQAV